MSDSKLRGVFVPMITVFKEDGSIDEEGIRRQVNFLIENGVHGIIPCGSTGEFIALNLDERKRVAKIVVEEAAGRVPIYVGTAHYRTDKTIELSKHAESIGADGVMIVSPYYLKRNRREIMEHYRSVAESVNALPIMLYNNPHFSGTDMTPDFIAEVYKNGYISSVKEGEGDPARTQELRYLTDENLRIFYGYDTCVIEALVMGCDGWVAGTANLIPRHCVKVYELVKDGQIEEAKKFWYNEVKQFIDLCTHPYQSEGAPWLAVLKEGLNMIGERGGFLLKPNLPLPADIKDRLHQVLKKMGYF